MTNTQPLRHQNRRETDWFKDFLNNNDKFTDLDDMCWVAKQLAKPPIPAARLA